MKTLLAVIAVLLVVGIAGFFFVERNKRANDVLASELMESATELHKRSAYLSKWSSKFVDDPSFVPEGVDWIPATPDARSRMEVKLSGDALKLEAEAKRIKSSIWTTKPAWPEGPGLSDLRPHGSPSGGP
jgi:hypothetical protein